ncbi:MAG: hypothetical protein OJF50_003167 [Nitrospira sp.]|nr:hypothetical protein [Nitrospira sp.]
MVGASGRPLSDPWRGKFQMEYSGFGSEPMPTTTRYLNKVNALYAL